MRVKYNPKDYKDESILGDVMNGLMSSESVKYVHRQIKVSTNGSVTDRTLKICPKCNRLWEVLQGFAPARSGTRVLYVPQCNSVYYGKSYSTCPECCDMHKEITDVSGHTCPGCDELMAYCQYGSGDDLDEGLQCDHCGYQDDRMI